MYKKNFGRKKTYGIGVEKVLFGTRFPKRFCWFNEGVFSRNALVFASRTSLVYDVTEVLMFFINFSHYLRNKDADY